MSGTEIAQMLLDHDGYIVMASNKKLKIGDIVEDDLSPTLDGSEPVKVVVVATSSHEEFIRQSLKVDPACQWRDISAWASRYRFYKVTAE